MLTLEIGEGFVSPDKEPSVKVDKRNHLRRKSGNQEISSDKEVSVKVEKRNQLRKSGGYGTG